MQYDDDGKKLFKCVVHHDQMAFNVYMAKENDTKHMIRYGLCVDCAHKIQIDKNGFFAEVIDKALCEFLIKRGRKNVASLAR